jgi:hypothetical protein
MFQQWKISTNNEMLTLDFCTYLVTYQEHRCATWQRCVNYILDPRHDVERGVSPLSQADDWVCQVCACTDMWCRCIRHSYVGVQVQLYFLSYT